MGCRTAIVTDVQSEMTSKPVLYLHIGMPKCGTTAIQKALGKKRQLLKKHGTIYPNFGKGPFHHCLYFSMAQGRDEETQSYVTQIKQHISEGYNVILSTENFCWSPLKIRPSKIKSVLDLDVDFKIIFYARNIYDFIHSSYCQSVQGFNSQSKLLFEEYVNSKRINNFSYSNIISSWSDIFSKENMNIRIYDRNNFYKGDIVSDFLHTCNVKDAVSDNVKSEMANVTASYPAIYALAHFNKTHTFSRPDMHSRFLASVTELIEGNAGIKSFWTEKTANHVEQLFGSEREHLSEILDERFVETLFEKPKYEPFNKDAISPQELSRALSRLSEEYNLIVSSAQDSNINADETPLAGAAAK